MYPAGTQWHNFGTQNSYFYCILFDMVISKSLIANLAHLPRSILNLSCVDMHCQIMTYFFRTRHRNIRNWRIRDRNAGSLTNSVPGEDRGGQFTLGERV